MSKNPTPELLEIIDRHAILGTPGVINDRAIPAFRNEVMAYYDTWSAPALGPGQIRLGVDLRSYRGFSSVASSTSMLTDAQLEQASDDGDEFVYRMMRRSVLGPLLYADQLVDQDPLSFERYFSDDEQDHLPTTMRICDALIGLKKVRPLIEAGILVMAPICDPNDGVDDATEARAYGQFARKWLDDSPDEVFVPYGIDRWYVRDALRTTQSTSAALVVRAEWQWRYLEFLYGRSLASDAAPPRVAAGLASAELPMFAGVAPKTLVSIHENEDAFIEWRASLRTAARLIRVECTESDFQGQAKEVYQDILLPHVAAVKRATSRSRALTTMAKEQPLRIGLGAGMGMAAAVSLGFPVAGVAVSSIAGAVANIAYAGLNRPKHSGVSAIVSMLQNRR